MMRVAAEQRAVDIRRDQSGGAVELGEADGLAGLASFISDIEDVDMAEAVTRLNQAQASAKVLAQIRQLSLLDYLD